MHTTKMITKDMISLSVPLSLFRDARDGQTWHCGGGSQSDRISGLRTIQFHYRTTSYRWWRARFDDTQINHTIFSRIEPQRLYGFNSSVRGALVTTFHTSLYQWKLNNFVFLANGYVSVILIIARIIACMKVPVKSEPLRTNSQCSGRVNGRRILPSRMLIHKTAGRWKR